MAIRYKFDILASLKEAGYTTYRLRVDKMLNESAIHLLRKNELISWENIDSVCKYLKCQPGDVLEYVEDNEG